MIFIMLNPFPCLETFALILWEEGEEDAVSVLPSSRLRGEVKEGALITVEFRGKSFPGRVTTALGTFIIMVGVSVHYIQYYPIFRVYSSVFV